MFAVFGLGPQEIALLVVAGVLLFGRKLPEIGSSLGKTIVSFRKSMSGVEEDIASTPIAQQAPVVPARVPALAPKFQDNA